MPSIARLLGPIIALAMLATTVGPARPEPDQIALTPAAIENYIAVRPELDALAADFVRRYGDRSESAGATPVLALAAYQDIPEAHRDTLETLARHGFPDLDAWQRTSDAITLALPYVDDANPPPDVEADRAKARADVEQDGSLDAGHKEEALKALDQQFAPLLEIAPLPANVEIVRRFKDRLGPLTGAN